MVEMHVLSLRHLKLGRYGVLVIAAAYPVRTVDFALNWSWAVGLLC